MSKPSISLDEYKKVMELKSGGAHPNAYMRLAKNIGVPTQRLLNISRKRIKQYDYKIWKDEQSSKTTEQLNAGR